MIWKSERKDILTDEQLNVWATGVVDLDVWNQSFLEHYTIVSLKNKEIVGFGVDKVITQASITAKPFFKNRRYRVVKIQNVERNGIFLTNYLMEKTCCHAILA